MSSLTSPSNMDSDPFPFLPSWRSGLPHLGENATSWSPSYQSRSSRFRRAYQLRGLSGWLRWGVCAAIGLYLGLSTEVADHLMLRGRWLQASELSPWNRYIRTKVGYVALMYGDLDKAIAVLKTDPWSGDLTYGIAALYYTRGDMAGATRYAARFVEVAPNSRFIQRAQ